MQVTSDCLSRLSKFMELWLSLLQEQRLSSSLIHPTTANSSNSRQLLAGRLLASTSSQDASGTPAAVRTSLEVGPEPADAACYSLDLHRLEGVFFMLLCSFDATIRLDAYHALGVLRMLHQQLYTMAAELGVEQGDAAQPHQVQQGQQPASQVLAGGIGGSFSSVSTLTVAGAGQEGGGAAAAVTPAASVASGSGMFFRHKATASRDSADFMQTLGGFCLLLSSG